MPASASRISRLLAAGGLLLATLAATAASCTAALALDDYVDGPHALCTLLDGCYAKDAPDGCQDHITRALGEAGTAAGDDWIHVIGQGCLENCTAARYCLDVDPVCAHAPLGTCQRREDCCAFSDGLTDCNVAAQQCCFTAGQRCETDQECCLSAGLCSPLTHTCGGRLCRQKNARCALGEECCSGTCLDHRCRPKICDDDGFTCADGSTCCSRFCRDGRCGQPPTCLLALSPCTSPDQCCDGFCYLPPEASEGVCSTGSGCLPLEADCGNDEQCCPLEGAASGYCDPTYHKCSAQCVQPAGSTCMIGADCCSGECDDGACRTCSSAACQSDDDCCSLHCVATTCAPKCGMTSCDHGVCLIGGALDPHCANGDACITAICDTDPYCCCIQWDALCVKAVSANKVCSPSGCP